MPRTRITRLAVTAAAIAATALALCVSSVLPKPFRALAAAADGGDAARLTEAQAAVDDVVGVIGGDMARMKAAYRSLGIADGVCRMALTEPDGAALAAIDRVLAAYR